MTEHDHHHDHDDWKLKLDADEWDEHYESAPTIWSGRPNPVLVAEAADLTPGRALDVGCGEGADALWLAVRGWEVTGIDISQVALDRAAAHVAAAGHGERVVWEQRDLLDWTPPARSFDLVSAQYFHLPADLRNRAYDKLAGAVAPGGTLLVGAHHPSDLETTMDRPPVEELFFTADELAERLDDAWDIQIAEKRTRTAADNEGREVDVADTVLKARRSG